LIKIKLSIPGFESHKIDISEFTGSKDGVFLGCQFYINRKDIKEADYWFCFEDIIGEEESCLIDPRNIFFLTAEAAWPQGYFDDLNRVGFLKQFSRIFTCHDIYLPNVTYSLPFLPWMINANHGSSIFESSHRDCEYLDALERLKKPKLLSVFCSKQIWTEDHRLRLKFVKALKKHFGERLDWFGNGINPLEQKWEGISPYKYHITLENQSRNNIITEKLYDAFLGLSYPIYWGAPNASSYFPEDSFTTIDIVDVKGAIEKIEQLLSSDTYEKALPSILVSKKMVLNEYNLFRRLVNICQDANDLNKTLDKQYITLQPVRKVNALRDIRESFSRDEYRVSIRKMALLYPGKLIRRVGNKLIAIYGE
jgi:hypothetical protein